MKQLKPIRHLPAGFELNPPPRQGNKFPRISAVSLGAVLFALIALLLLLGE